MLTHEEYEFLVPLKENPVELPWPLPSEWKTVEQYIYCIEEYPLHCTTGVKMVPWRWTLNVYGLEELALYEKFKERLSDEVAQKSAKSRHKAIDTAVRIAEGIAVAVLGALLFHALSVMFHFG